MEQLVIIINNEKETEMYATAPGVDATGLDQVDFLIVREKGGKLRKLNRSNISQWWEKDMEDGSLLILEDGKTPYFKREPDEGMKNIFVEMQRASKGRVQPLREFEYSPTVQDIENSQDTQMEDPDKIIDLVNFDKEICWTNRKDYEAAMPKAKKGFNGKSYINSDEINLDCALTLEPDDFFYLNNKNKIYAYIHKTTEICVEDHSIGYY